MSTPTPDEAYLKFLKDQRLELEKLALDLIKLTEDGVKQAEQMIKDLDNKGCGR